LTSVFENEYSDWGSAPLSERIESVAVFPRARKINGRIERKIGA